MLHIASHTLGQSHKIERLQGSADDESKRRRGWQGSGSPEYRIINIRSENYRIDPTKESELDFLGDKG